MRKLAAEDGEAAPPNAMSVLIQIAVMYQMHDVAESADIGKFVRF